MGQSQEALQPRVLRLAIFLDRNPGIGPADDGTNGQGHNVKEVVQTGAFQARVFEGRKMGNQGAELPCRHDEPPGEQEETPSHDGTG